MECFVWILNFLLTEILAGKERNSRGFSIARFYICSFFFCCCWRAKHVFIIFLIGLFEDSLVFFGFFKKKEKQKKRKDFLGLCEIH